MMMWNVWGSTRACSYCKWAKFPSQKGKPGFFSTQGFLRHELSQCESGVYGLIEAYLTVPESLEEWPHFKIIPCDISYRAFRFRPLCGFCVGLCVRSCALKLQLAKT